MANRVIIADKLSIKDSAGKLSEVALVKTPVRKTVKLPVSGWISVENVSTFIYSDTDLADDSLISLTPSLSLTNAYEVAQAVIVVKHEASVLTFSALGGTPAADVEYELTIL